MNLFQCIDYYIKCLYFAICVRALAGHDVNGEEVGLAVVLDSVGVVTELAVCDLRVCEIAGKARGKVCRLHICCDRARLLSATSVEALGSLFTLPSAVSFLVFCLLYTPCVAALAALRRELGSGVKTVLVMLSQCCVAWLAAFCVYMLMGVIL